MIKAFCFRRRLKRTTVKKKPLKLNLLKKLQRKMEVRRRRKRRRRES